MAEKGAGSAGSASCYLSPLSDGNLREDGDDGGDCWRVLGTLAAALWGGGGKGHWDAGGGGGRVSKVGCHGGGLPRTLGLKHLLQSFFSTKKLKSPSLIFRSRVSDLFVVG